MGAKLVSTPLAIYSTLTLHDGSPPSDATQYHYLIGNLQYLQLTQLDIAFAVNKVSQYMHLPSSLFDVIVLYLFMFTMMSIRPLTQMLVLRSVPMLFFLDLI